jgi:lipoprotein-releasing system permease protein
MKAAWFIARRYFISKKKQNFINILSVIALLGVSLGTIALVVVLSVFNGLEDLLRNLFGSFDPDIQITAAEGKSFDYDKDIEAKIKNTKGIALYMEVVEDNALIKYKENQSVVKIKGVTSNIIERKDLEDHIVDGRFELFKDGTPRAILGRGVQYKLSVPVNERFVPLQVLYPKNLKRLSLSPDKALNRKQVLPGGIFALEEYYDNNYVFVPLDFAIELFEYKNKRTAIELMVENEDDIHDIQTTLKTALGDKFLVQNADEQHEALYKAIKVEKLFVNLAFIFILVIVSFNIFFALSMLALEKKRDIAMLFAMGATPKLVSRVFLLEGLIIGLSGMLLGLALGYGLCYGQENYGWVSMGLETAVADAYPLKIEYLDFVMTAAIVIFITFMSSLNPALIARKNNNMSALQS